MTPGARIQAAIELLQEIEQAAGPAERTVESYLRSRRYIGGGDRRNLTDRVHGVLRRRARLDWWLEKLGGPTDSRARVLAFLRLAEGLPPGEIAALFDGQGYGPPAMSPAEATLLEGLEGARLTDPSQPLAVRVEMPDWLIPYFERAFGPALEAELAALRDAAPLDLRINALRANRGAALAALAAEGIAAEPTPLSPLGLRVKGRRSVKGTRAYRGGLVELQDEASQLAALLCGVRPGMTVADFCAGAGGKTLALAAAMAGRGRLVALDRDAARLDLARPRLKRAGVRNVELAALTGEKGRDRDGGGPRLLRALKGVCDRVLVDAPCSGSGAWRRHPHARWRLTPEALEGYRKDQAAALDAAAGLVAPGGRLIYVTCSLLAEENGGQVDAFLAAMPAFRQLSMAEVWRETFDAAPPDEGLGEGPGLLLTPARHGTDGFFIAVLARAAVS
jgi:16S rRNA (cytosine967-C5)-methyltransferase